MPPEPLSDEERAVYEWQIWVPQFGEEGQEKLKGASVDDKDYADMKAELAAYAAQIRAIEKLKKLRR